MPAVVAAVAAAVGRQRRPPLRLTLGAALPRLARLLQQLPGRGRRAVANRQALGIGTSKEPVSRRALALGTKEVASQLHRVVLLGRAVVQPRARQPRLGSSPQQQHSLLGSSLQQLVVAILSWLVAPMPQLAILCEARSVWSQRTIQNQSTRRASR